MNKDLIIISCMLSIFALTLGSFFFIEESNKKFTIDYLKNQCTVSKIDSAFYECTNSFYNEISTWEIEENQEKYKIFSFSMRDSNNSYEIARIRFNQKDNQVTECSYDFAETWEACNEKDFIKSFSKIFELKSQVYTQLKENIEKQKNENYSNSETNNKVQILWLKLNSTTLKNPTGKNDKPIQQKDLAEIVQESNQTNSVVENKIKTERPKVQNNTKKTTPQKSSQIDAVVEDFMN